MAATEQPVAFPVAVIADTREQQPYTFRGLSADKRQGGGRLVVGVRRATLPTGDYSLEGFTDQVAVERKSLNDLYHTLSQGRDRFERELARLNGMRTARVVVEAEWSTIVGDPPPFSKLTPKSVYRSVLAWMERFPRVHWLPVPGREFAEVTTLRVLERFLREREREKHESKPRGKR
jgi:ERCC4-type nuclease